MELQSSIPSHLACHPSHCAPSIPWIRCHFLNTQGNFRCKNRGARAHSFDQPVLKPGTKQYSCLTPRLPLPRPLDRATPVSPRHPPSIPSIPPIQPTADTRDVSSCDGLEHFPPKWSPVRRRKCDKQRTGAVSTRFKSRGNRSSHNFIQRCINDYPIPVNSGFDAYTPLFQRSTGRFATHGRVALIPQGDSDSV